MIDGLGRPQHVLVVGGTSEIGLAICRALVASMSPVSFTLLGRSSDALQVAADQLSHEAHGAQVKFARVDLNDPLGTAETVEQLWKVTDFDLVLLTAGVLSNSSSDPVNHRRAVSAAMVNFVGQLAVGTKALHRFDERGSGYLVVISSVAAERIRPDNYLYGATKSGLDGWAVGAAHARRNSPVRVMVVRPGMVCTRMSAGMDEIPFTTDAQHVARRVIQSLRRGPVVVWSPPILRFVMMALRHLPARVFFALASRDEQYSQ